APCNGDTGWLRVHAPESPNPMPGVPRGTYGASLPAQVRAGQSISVDSWTLTDPKGAMVPATQRAFGSDPNNGVAIHRAVLIPNTVLAPNTTYNVVLRGKNSGIPFERRYSFTTGAN
ncbi:MAG: fibronectin type III domain-containing protein, partial [Pseudomonadota bacterium]